MQKLSKNDELDAILIFNQYINQIQGSYKRDRIKILKIVNFELLHIDDQ